MGVLFEGKNNDFRVMRRSELFAQLYRKVNVYMQNKILLAKITHVHL